MSCFKENYWGTGCPIISFKPLLHIVDTTSPNITMQWQMRKLALPLQLNSRPLNVFIMDASTTINQMLSGNKIFVPTYQRAYSWEDKQTKQFLVDLQDYVESHTASSYYFGHFLFEDKGSRNFAIIDGQQRLTTITIFISAIYRRLEELAGALSEDDVFSLWHSCESRTNLQILYC